MVGRCRPPRLVLIRRAKTLTWRGRRQVTTLDSCKYRYRLCIVSKESGAGLIDSREKGTMLEARNSGEGEELVWL